MKQILVYLALLAGIMLPAMVEAGTNQLPGKMSVAVFMAKVEALRAQGAMALFSSDVSLLKSEVASSAQAFRRQLKVEAANGKPSACPPEHSSLTSEDILAQMRSYPVALRPRIPVSEAVADLLRRRFPCPAH